MTEEGERSGLTSRYRLDRRVLLRSPLLGGPGLAATAVILCGEHEDEPSGDRGPDNGSVDSGHNRASVVVVLYTSGMQRILVVSDDPQHMTVAAAAMRLDGRPVRTERTLEAGLLAVREWRPAVLVLDLGIGITPGGLAAVLRDPEVHERIGVLLVASHDQLGMVAAGVRIDDFVMPPLEAEEFRTRIGRVLWAHTGADEGSLLRRRGLVIDLERYTVSVDGDVVDLTYKEYELLRFLATNAGKPFTREALLNRVWGYDYYGGSRTVDVHIRRIRAKIERHEAYIDTVRNVGYRFIDDAPPGSRLEVIDAESA